MFLFIAAIFQKFLASFWKNSKGFVRKGALVEQEQNWYEDWTQIFQMCLRTMGKGAWLLACSL